MEMDRVRNVRGPINENANPSITVLTRKNDRITSGNTCGVSGRRRSNGRDYVGAQGCGEYFYDDLQRDGKPHFGKRGVATRRNERARLARPADDLRPRHRAILTS